MRGFSNKFRDLPDYILKVTREIWEERGLDTLNHYYAENIPVRAPGGLMRGRHSVINNSLGVLAEFPDRELFGEDVIWSGDEEDGFLSSHRLLTTGTHTGQGSFGAPTGKRFEIRALADCAAKSNEIYDEWLIRDVAGIVKQLGYEPRAYAHAMIEAEGGPKRCVKPFTPDQDVDGGYHGRGNDNIWGERLANILTRLMDKDFAVIPALYDRACHIHHSGARDAVTWRGADQLWLPFRSSFPDAVFEIHHQIGRDDPMMPPRAAIRWSLDGTHDGWGAYGKPTGAQVHIMGITHAEFGPFGNTEDWSIRHEFTLVDEVAIWKQILMQTGEF